MDPRIKALIDGHTLDELRALPDDNPLAPGDVPAVADALWQKHVAEVKADPTRVEEDSKNRIVIQGSTMNYYVDVIGTKPADGYPVYICLHGGGGGTGNDDQWRAMQTHYRSSVKTGIYIAPRGMSDTWNLHFLPQSYPAYDRLIENMIVFKDADPNRVYLLGFSAGGDGVYQISTRMPDRFAAANMSSGHPNGVSLDNLRGLPFCMQVGEYDFSYDRNIVAAQYGHDLTALQVGYGGYTHETMVHRAGNHNAPWKDNDASATATYPVYDDPETWRTTWIKDTGNNWKKTAPVEACVKPDPAYAAPAASCITGVPFTDKDSNAVRWTTQYVRDPKPTRVRWDLKTTAPSRPGTASDGGKTSKTTNLSDLFYWMENKAPADIEVKDNTITLVKCPERLDILLDGTMVDLARPIQVDHDDDKFTAIPLPTLKTMVCSLIDRGDKNYVFAARLSLAEHPFSCMVGYNCYKSQQVATGSGVPFSDFEAAARTGAKLTSLTVGHGDVLDSLQADYGKTALDRHGGPGGAKTTLRFEADEPIRRIHGTTGSYYGARHVTTLYIVTDRNIHGPFGSGMRSTDSKDFDHTVPDGMTINAFQGRSLRHSDGTDYISALDVAYSKLG